MYIQKAEIKNIRLIIDFEIEFKNPAGWHVLIGDNGAGKSTIIRSMALALVNLEVNGLRANWNEWLNKKSEKGEISLYLFRDEVWDDIDIGGWMKSAKHHNIKKDKVEVNIILYRENDVTLMMHQYSPDKEDRKSEWLVNRTSGFFSVAFGPYRRFEGGNPEWEKVFENPSLANLAAHLSIFGEDVALTQATEWLKDLFNTSNDPTLSKKERKLNSNQLEYIKSLINSDDFLPNNSRLKNVNSQGVFFTDGNDTTISVSQMSDGYRSILSLTFELIRQLVRVYGSESVFKSIEKGEMFIDLPGVVLVDEIDAHLHPTWQTRIGNWFLKYFPKLQFIVTTHSPLVCRAAENGSIWRLAAPGSDEKSGEIVGVDRERLIYGNILDAYGTEVFGEDVSISQDSVEKQEELVKLSKKKMLDAISPDEEKELENLRKVFTTDAPIEL